MKSIPDHLFKKLEQVGNEVKDSLRRKGIVIPVENEDGSISIGSYTIIKNDQGFYSILDYSNTPVIGNINLPQTAALLANGLALGKFMDFQLVDEDRRYGYALFEENLHKRNLQKKRRRDPDYIDMVSTKCLIAQAKKNRYKRGIDNSFEKLRKLV